VEVFKLNNVTKQFSEQFVLRDFSFEIRKGDKVIILGRSGIGKTTLFRLLLGFEKPDSGEIYFDDRLVDDDTVWKLRRKVAYVSQDLNIGHGNLQTFFNETLALKANLSSKKPAHESLNALLAYFELPETVLQKNIEELSGGEKQRVAIINALLLRRTIFLLDEITSALDKSLKSKVMDYFLLNPYYTILSISHDNYVPTGVVTKTLKLD
jgi:putative ABC transport system ATP-binding protein